MGTIHSRAARSARSVLYGVSGLDAVAAAQSAASLGVLNSYGSAEALLADDAIDIVHIVTPNAFHMKFALAAIASGKHVICEKPLATSTADAQRLADAARAAGVVAAVPFVYRFHPMVREARARIQRGDAGRILSFQGSYLQDWLVSATVENWRVDAKLGGPSRAFADVGSHLCDLLEFVLGDQIARLQAVKRTVFNERASSTGITTEDLAALLVETRSGAVGTLLVSQVAPGRKNRLHIEVAGTDESIAFDQEDPETLWIGRRVGSEFLRRNPEELSAEAARLSVVPAGHPQGYQDAFNAFVSDTYSTVQGVARDGLPTFEDGLRAVRVTDAVLESARTGAWIAV